MKIRDHLNIFGLLSVVSLSIIPITTLTNYNVSDNQNEVTCLDNVYGLSNNSNDSLNSYSDSNYDFKNNQKFKPTSINPNGIIDYQTVSLNGLASPNFEFFYGNLEDLVDSDTITTKVNVNKVDVNVKWINADSGKFSWEQLFLNEKVAQYIVDTINKTLPESSKIISIKDPYVYDQSYTDALTDIDLSELYKDDPYKDETIKALMNPTISKLFAKTKQLYLNDNGLWNIPLFGYDYDDSPTKELNSFQALEILNLSNNAITKLPANKINVRNDFDLSNTLPKLLEPQGLLLNGNFLLDESITFKNEKKVSYDKTKQSTWFYNDPVAINAFIEQYFISKSINLNDYYLTDKIMIDNIETTVFDKINELIGNYYRNNYLGSSTVYNITGNKTPTSTGVIMYMYTNTNNATGEIIGSVEVKQFQYYDNATGITQNNSDVYLALTLSGFKQDPTIPALVISFSCLVGILIVSFAIYTIYFKKKVAANKKQKAVEKMNNKDSEA